MSLYNFFKNKKVLVTGHTGFKGSWLMTWLNILGCKVLGISLDPINGDNHFKILKKILDIIDKRGDIRNEKYLKNKKFKWKINLIDTGLKTMTGGRLKRLKRLLGKETFLIKNDQTFLEKEPLEKVSYQNQLMAFKHKGFWQCMDSKRDKDKLEQILQNK